MSWRDVTDLRMERGTDPGATALFSANGKYRYVLERRLLPRPEARNPGTRLVACGLNPSTADAFKLDPTCRREINYAMAWGCDTYVKINAYAWRDTHPSAMWRARRGGADVIGASNDAAIEMALTQLKRDGGIALAAWGVGVKADRILQLLRISASVGVQWMCLDTCASGEPAHPLIRRRLSKDGAAPTPRPWP